MLWSLPKPGSNVLHWVMKFIIPDFKLLEWVFKLRSNGIITYLTLIGFRTQSHICDIVKYKQFISYCKRNLIFNMLYRLAISMLLDMITGLEWWSDSCRLLKATVNMRFVHVFVLQPFLFRNIQLILENKCL